eukprot:jgi/Orpsp1_1/1175058/evm.model.c7180000052477.2
MKFNDKIDIHMFIPTLDSTLSELENIDSKIKDESKVEILNRALPEELRFINVFTHKKSWKKCCKYVCDVILPILLSRMKEDLTGNNLQENIYSDESNKEVNKCPKGNGRYQFCGKYGHFKKSCRNKFKKNYTKYRKYLPKRRFRKFSNHGINKRNIKNKRSKNLYNIPNISNSNKNIYADAFTRDYCSEGEYESNCIYNNNANDDDDVVTTWIMDSGASINNVGDIDLLNCTKPHSEYITLLEGERLKSCKIGEYQGYINNHIITLKKVYYVPQIKRNLISLNELIKKGYKVIFNKENISNKPMVVIYNNNNNERIYIGHSNNSNTFRLWITKTQHKFNQPHMELSKDILMVQLSNAESSEFMNLWHRRCAHFQINQIKDKLKGTRIREKCRICVQSKLRNAPHMTSENKTTFPLEYILMKVKAVKSDNAKEFKSTEFNNLCTKYGIIQLYTIPYNPQQNGRAESLNCTLISYAIALLQDEKLSKRFWENAIETVNYVHNRLSHRGNLNKIPYEILTNKVVDYSQLRIILSRTVEFFEDDFANFKLANCIISGTATPIMKSEGAFDKRIKNKNINDSTITNNLKNIQRNSTKIIKNKNNLDFNDKIPDPNYHNTNNKRSQDQDINESNKRLKTKDINMDDGINSKTIIEPLSYSDIQNYKDSKEWKEAIELELNNMKSHNVYEFVKELPPNTNVVNSRW